MKETLRRTAEAYAALRGISMQTLGRLAAGDWRFFDRLADDEKTFTARKFDEVMLWFSENWPKGSAWPKRVKRPEAA